MSRESKLLKNTGVVAFGKICTQFLNFFLLPLYTAVLSTKEYGIVDLLNTYVFLFIPLIIFQIDQGIFRFLIDARKNEEEKKELISTTFFVVFIQSVLFLILYLLVSIFIKNEYKYFLATNVVANIFSSILLQISRGLGDNKTYSFGSLLAATSAIIFNLFFLLILHMGAYGMLIATFLSNIVCSVYIVFRKKIYRYISYKNFNYNTLKKMWKYSIPLVPNMLSWWVVSASDRTIITTFIDVAANGIYSAANKFSSVCINFFNVFNLAWAESTSEHVNDKDSDEYFSNMINKGLRFFSGVCILIISFMPFVFSLLINKKFENAYFQIPILMISTLFNIFASLVGSIYVAKKNSKAIAKTSLLAALLNIVVNISLIKYIGLYAASISTLIAYFVMAMYRYFDVKKYVKISIDKDFIFYTVLVLMASVSVYYIKFLFLNILIVFISLLYSYIINRELIILILKKASKKLKTKKMEN